MWYIIDNVRLEADITDLVVENVIHSCVYNIYILASLIIQIQLMLPVNQISIEANLPKKPDFNYITSVSVNHKDGSVDISCYIDNTAIISKYEVDRTEKETQKFNYIGDIPFPHQMVI